MRFASISGAIVGFVLLAQSAQAQQGPSFSCANVRQPWAVVICSDAELSGLDSAIGEKYKAVRDTLVGNTLLAFIDNQLNWIATMKAECGFSETGPVETRNIPSLAGCLWARFSQRITAFDNGSWADPRAAYELGLDQAAREQVQGRLAALGHYKDKPDGRFGPGMRHAIAAAQRQFGLPQSGFVTGALVGKLNLVVQAPALNQAVTPQTARGLGRQDTSTLASPVEPLSATGRVDVQAEDEKANGEDGKARIHIQMGHMSDVNSFAQSPDGRLIMSSDGGSTRLWDVGSGRELRRFDGMAPLVFSPDGQFVLSRSQDFKLRLRNISSGEEVYSLEGGGVAAISPNGKFVISGSKDNVNPGRQVLNRDFSLRLWELDSGREVRRFVGHTDYVRFIAFMPDGQHAISGSSDNSVRLWDISTGRELRRIEGRGPISAISPDGRFAVLGCVVLQWHILYFGNLALDVASASDGLVPSPPI